MWLTFLVIGLIVGAAFWLIERRKWRLLPRLGLLLCTVIVFAIAVYLMSGVTFLGEAAWYDRFPYREIILFLIMLIGMVARTLTLAIERRRKVIARLSESGAPLEKPKLDLDVWEFSYPFLASVLTFGGLLSQIGDEHLSLLVLILAFQTGFFWQTLLKRD